MDVVSGLPQRSHELGEFFFTIDQYLYRIATGQGAFDSVKQQRANPPAFGELLFVELVGMQGVIANSLADPLSNGLVVHEFLAVQLTFSVVDSERKIEEYTDDGQEDDQQQVSNRLGVVDGIVDNPKTHGHDKGDIEDFKKNEPIH